MLNTSMSVYILFIYLLHACDTSGKGLVQEHNNLSIRPLGPKLTELEKNQFFFNLQEKAEMYLSSTN